MNKKYIFLPIILLAVLFLASCANNDPASPEVTVGSVYVTSTPVAAAIWVDGTNSGKITPDTIANLTSGNHTFILKLANYFNDTSTVSVSKGTQNWSRTLIPSVLGSVYVTSTPDLAQIWVDGINTGKVTPDTVANLNVGNHSFILKLNNYVNDTAAVNVQQGPQSLHRTLTVIKSITQYGPVQAWESADPSATDPSGIVLKSGQAVSIGTSTYGPVDVYYSSNGYVVATAYGLHSNTGRSTSFLVGSSNDLTDGVTSPLATNSWATQVLDTETNYFFLFDSDNHYSKMIITGRGGGTPGNPAWITVKWIYNNNPNDQRF